MNGPRYDLLLTGGRVIDPAGDIDGPADVAVTSGKIAAVAPGIDPGLAAQVVDVSGRLVTPGLIDIHAHVYDTQNPNYLSVMADAHCLPSGVTTVVDPGTAGAAHFDHFRETVIEKAKTRILALVNIVRDGMLGDWEHDLEQMDPEIAAKTVAANPDVCVGIKTAHYWTKHPFDDAHPPWAAVERALAAGEMCGKPVMFDYWGRPERPYAELILKRMRPGDIHTHCFAQQFGPHGTDSWPQGHHFEARERGVIFDVGHGAASFWFRLAQAAMDAGFPPDSISTDLHTGNMNGPVFDMLNVMSKFLNMGMSLPEVIMRSTINPAREIGRPDLGTLTPGSEADIAVLDQQEGEFRYTDCGRACIRGRWKLECTLTMRAGKIVYDPNGCSMPYWQDAPAPYWVTPLLQA